jgi:hypothetical protein
MEWLGSTLGITLVIMPKWRNSQGFQSLASWLCCTTIPDGDLLKQKRRNARLQLTGTARAQRGYDRPLLLNTTVDAGTLNVVKDFASFNPPTRIQ